MYRYDTILVNEAEGFHMADIGTELRILFPPRTCLAIQVSAIFFTPLNFHHAPILFPSSQELLVFYIHTPLEGLDPTMADSREDKAKRHLAIKIQKTSKSFMLFDDWIKYSKQLVKYIQNPTPSLFETHTEPHVDRKTEHIRVG